MNEAAKLLAEFARFIIPRIPEVAPHFVSFWGEKNLGPMPPDIQAWDDVDKRVDAQLVMDLERQKSGMR